MRSLILGLFILTICVARNAYGQPDYLEYTPLERAVFQHDYDLEERLLHSGADPNARNRYGVTALFLAVGYDDSLSISLLAAYGGDVNQVDSIYGTHSIYGSLVADAAASNATYALNALIANHAKIAVKNQEGETPLHLAAHNGHLEAMQILLRNGADRNCLAKYGETPLYTAVMGGKPAAVELLLVSGANPNPVDSAFESPLLLACSLLEGSREAETQKVGDEISFHDSTGTKRRAIYNSIIDLLLKYHADPSLANHHWKQTPWHVTAERCDSTLARKLMRYGQPTNLKDKDGLTPIEIAEKQNCEAVLKILCQSKR